MTLSPKLGVVGISTLWHFRLPMPIQMFIKVASSPRLSGIGMPILWSHPLKMQRIVLLSSLLWWELGTNSLITGPGQWLSFRRFTSKLSWSWSWCLLNTEVHQYRCGVWIHLFFHVPKGLFFFFIKSLLVYTFQGRQPFRTFKLNIFFQIMQFWYCFASTNYKIWKVKLTEKCFSLKLHWYKYRITK